MLTCERCHATFAPTKGVVEVTTLSVLCPTCLAEHLAAKAAKRAGKVTAPAAPPAALAPPPAPPAAPARPPAAPARPPAAPARPPAAPARPPAVPARPPAPAVATATAPKAAPKVEPKAEPRGTTPAAAPRAARAEARKPAAREKGRKSAPREASQISTDLKKKGKREIVVAFTSAGVVMVLAGVVLWKVLAQKRAEAAEIQAQEERVEAFRSEFMGIDIQTEEGAQRLLVLAEEQKAQWTDADFASDVVNRTAKAKTYLEGLEEKRVLTQRLEEIEGVLARASEIAPSELAEQRRRLDELASKTQMLGAEFAARVAKDRAFAEETYLEGLLTAARTAAATEPLDRAALATIQQAEDEILKIFEVSYRAWESDKKNPEVTAKKDSYQERYQALIALSDAAVQRFFTPEVIESTPWRDLLSSEHAGEWRGPTLKGFEHRIEDGVLHMIGPDPSEDGEGIISIGDKEAWRDFVIDAEFTIAKGGCTIFFRLPAAWQENVESVDLTTDEGALEADRSYTYTFDVIGSTLVEQNHGEDSFGPNVVAINWTRIRKGAFGISIPSESEVRFTRLRAKVLR